MNMHAKHQLTLEVLPRYLKADKEAKGRILDEYCANTKYERKYAITKLRTYQLMPAKKFHVPGKHSRRREKVYDMAVEEAVSMIWRTYDYLCAERLHPGLGKMVEKLVLCGELKIDPITEAKARKMSLSTLKRMLESVGRRETNRVSGTTRPGTLLKSEIPLRVGEWNETKPGFLETDTVAQCGDSAAGIFANTLTTTDIALTWFEAEAFLGKAQERVFQGIKNIRRRLPFELLGLDSDNGYEFINWEMYRYCKETNVIFTRSRPYKKNDNAHIEQKNWTCVRRILGYARIETQKQVDLMNKLFRGPLRDYINFCLPSVKCLEKKRIGARIVKKYDEAKTPCERALESKYIPEATKETLKKHYEKLNPVALKKEIDTLKKQIFNNAPKYDSGLDS